jgi:integrase
VAQGPRKRRYVVTELADIGPRRLQSFMDAVIAQNGPGAAKSCRSVLSGAFGLAARKEAIRSNPVATLERISQPRPHASSALPLDDVPQFLEAIRRDGEMRRLDLSDLFEFMVYTGCRIGEALALRWSFVDMSGGRVTFAGTVVRLPRRGAFIQEHGKTAESTRTIAVATPVRDLLARRRTDLDGDLVFPSMLGRLRDVDNTEADWRSGSSRVPDDDEPRPAEDLRDGTRRAGGCRRGRSRSTSVTSSPQ